MEGKPRKVAVLLGGKSTERDVAIRTGKQIAQALAGEGYIVQEIDTGSSFISGLQDFAPDVAFIALHGRFGEDGTIQGLLELLGIAYTGSGVLASALAMDKVMTKKVLIAEGISTPAYQILNQADLDLRELGEVAAEVGLRLGYPAVVKPSNQGSTIGISFPKNQEEMEQAILEALKYDKELLIEQFIEGMELTASVLGTVAPEVLPLIEIISDTGVYDYEAKYNLAISHHIIPAQIAPEVELKIKDLAVRTFKAIGCQQFTRVDFMLTRDQVPYVLEANTIPGMTETSLFPDAARHAGISFVSLVSRLVDEAWTLA